MRICEHEHRAVEQPMARQAWNDAEELNRLFSIVEMCHFSLRFFPMNFFPIKRIFALGCCFFSLDSCRAGMNLNQTFILEPDTVMHYNCMCIYMHSMSLFAHSFDF